MSAYTITAPYYDLLAASQQAGVDRQLLSELRDLAPVEYPVVDIGAGTGLTTRLIAEALPDAEILAIEPDPAMRAALMSRIWADPDLRRRVTVLPARLDAAPLPSTISAAVGSACLVHFAPPGRKALWALLAQRLAPRGVALFDIQCPVARGAPEASLGIATIGRNTYEGWAASERIDAQRLRFRLRYVTRFEGREIDSQQAEYVCWTASAQEVLAEAMGCGLSGVERDRLVILRRG